MKKLFFFILILFSLTACTPFLYHKTLHEPVKWSSMPIRVYLNLDQQTAHISMAAMNIWMGGTERQLFVATNKRHLANLRIKYDFDSCHDYSGKLTYGETKYQIYEDHAHFHKATILLCPLYRGQKIIFNVLAHELGHVLGLVHSNDPKSIMYPKMKPNAKLKSPSKKDLKHIRSMYK